VSSLSIPVVVEHTILLEHLPSTTMEQFNTRLAAHPNFDALYNY